MSRQPGPQPAAVYWRRRLVALVAGLSILALLAWGCAVALARLAGPARTQAGRGLPASRLAAAADVSTSAGAATSHQGTASQAAGGLAANTATPGKTSGSATPAGTAACPDGDVVLSLFASQAGYPLPGTQEFEVDVVSTARQKCTFDIGAGHVLLKVSAGSAQVWTSAQCAEGQASRVITLQRGVPAVIAMLWPGRRSAPGCPVPGASVPAGRYTAIATDGRLVSNQVTFRIR